ncbi:hypothetical protein GIB67_016081 [Kingdonia uniflora]|uniref:Uncharacterized protein n=1 Tax=Kingdonia uniflora TaxID=39325 RepID=A0A7J7L1X8_9MAGN|nr:hypothetical protein GIB67_016081 [Kingdonia uniflora]
MSSRPKWRRQHSCVQPLTPLMEGPDLDSTYSEVYKKESSWEAIRSWVRIQKGFSRPIFVTGNNVTSHRTDLRLLLGVLGCPLAPVPLTDDYPIHQLSLKDTPIENSSANYIIQQYLAATGCLKIRKNTKNMYTTGTVKMACCEVDGSFGKSSRNVNGFNKIGENGCFVLWQMSPAMWSIELVVAKNKVIAGSNGKIAWRHTPWLGTHAAKGPQRPLRRIIQGLDPKTTANLFVKAQCLGEKRIGDDDCFVLQVCADRDAVVERSDGPAEVLSHVLFGYFSQKSGLLIYMDDCHLTRVQAPGSDTVYWETTIRSSIGDYKDVDGIHIAHQGKSVATVVRFGGVPMQQSMTRMEEVWKIDDVVFDVPGLSVDHFIPPSDVFEPTHSP